MDVTESRKQSLLDGATPKSQDEFHYIEWVRDEMERERFEAEQRELENQAMEEHFAKHPHR